VLIGQTVERRRQGRFSIFQDGGVRHLGFLKLRNLATGSIRTANMRLHSKFRDAVERFLRYGRFSIFTRAAQLMRG